MPYSTAANTTIGSIVLLHQKSNNYKHTCVHGCTTTDQNNNNKVQPVILKSIAYNHPAVVLDLDYTHPEPWALIVTITHNPPKGFKSLPITVNPSTGATPATGALHLEACSGMDAGSNVLIDHAFWVPFGDLGTWGSTLQCRLQEGHYERLMTLLRLPQRNVWIPTQDIREMYPEMPLSPPRSPVASPSYIYDSQSLQGYSGYYSPPTPPTTYLPAGHSSLPSMTPELMNYMFPGMSSCPELFDLYVAESRTHGFI